jgi:hypothetical protein
MREANGFRWISVVCLMLSFGPVATAGPTTTAQRCGADQSEPPRRIFADPEGEHLGKEYPSANDLPQLSLDVGMVNAGMLVGSESKILFRVRQPGADYEAYTDYCFD